MSLHEAALQLSVIVTMIANGNVIVIIENESGTALRMQVAAVANCISHPPPILHLSSPCIRKVHHLTMIVRCNSNTPAVRSIWTVRHLPRYAIDGVAVIEEVVGDAVNQTIGDTAPGEHLRQIPGTNRILLHPQNGDGTDRPQKRIATENPIVAVTVSEKEIGMTAAAMTPINGSSAELQAQTATDDLAGHHRLPRRAGLEHRAREHTTAHRRNGTSEVAAAMCPHVRGIARAVHDVRLYCRPPASVTLAAAHAHRRCLQPKRLTYRRKSRTPASSQN